MRAKLDKSVMCAKRYCKHDITTPRLCHSSKYVYTPHGRSMEILRGWGSQNMPQNLKATITTVVKLLSLPYLFACLEKH